MLQRILIRTRERVAWIAALLASALLVTPTSATAQRGLARLVDVGVGIGVSIPYDPSTADAVGVFAKGEYVLGFSRWLEFRPYAGLLRTWPDNLDFRCTASPCDVSAAIGLFGGKGRLAAPIPWVAPFLELGLGASVGHVRTHTFWDELDIRGLMLHVPFTVGLALGPGHEVDVAFAYFFHPAARQASGGLEIGLSFPVGVTTRD